MSSARRLIALVLLGASFVGCQRAATPRTQQLSAAPIVQDEAMALRQWEPTVARYANGTSVAYPTLYPYVARRNVPGIESAVMNPVIFLGQTALLPLTILTTPAWEAETNRGVYTEPTYTAVPVVRSDAIGWDPVTRWEMPAPRR